MTATDPGRACPHENFAACVEVNPLTDSDDGPVAGYTTAIRQVW